MNKLCFGIDLGTTNSKAAFLDYRPSKTATPEELGIRQFENPASTNNFPSVVMFDPKQKEVIVGEYARKYSVNFPERSVRSVKRLMGKSWFHKVPGWDNLWTPQGISALLLKKILQETKDLHDKLNDLASVTISVPASFGSRQREATEKAAELAGFSGKIRLIDEPSAALIHWIYDRWELGLTFDREKTVLVFDMGGGTLDVSLAKVIPNKNYFSVSILSRSRYTELAGTEFDLRLAAYLVNRLQIEKVITNVDRGELDWKRIYRSALFDLAEPLKKEMSKYLKSHQRWGPKYRVGPPFDFNSNSSDVGCTVIPKERHLDLDSGPIELENIETPLAHFNEVLIPFFEAEEEDTNKTGTIYGPIIKALQEKNLSADDIDTVLLHGGMCTLPLIQVRLMNYFSEKVEIVTTPDLMTSVAKGAALYQASHNGHKLPIELEEPTLFESIFYETTSGFAEVVDKDRREGETGIALVPVPEGARTVRMRFYHGFSDKDPLLTHDRDLMMELDQPLLEEKNLELHWEVNPNRTVTYKWRDPSNFTEWKDLREASTGTKLDWYPRDLYLAEKNIIEQIVIK